MHNIESHNITGYTFGLVINNFHKKNNYNTSDISNINKLLLEHKLLIIKNINLDNDEFISFAKQFGDLEVTHPVEYQIPGYPYIRLQSNTSKSGIDYVGEYWHSDGSWLRKPTKVTLLLNLEAPELGGETLFIDMCAAYRDLPLDIKNTIDELNGYYPSREIYLKEMKALGLKISATHDKELSDVVHPIVRQHPITKYPALYLSENLLKNILELSDPESNMLLNYLYSFITQEHRIYKHQWKVGDLLIWDNASLVHKAMRPDQRYPKTTKRITVAA